MAHPKTNVAIKLPEVICEHEIDADYDELVNQAIVQGNAYASALISVCIGGEQLDVDHFAGEYEEHDIKASIEAEYDGVVTITLIDDEFDYSSDPETGADFSFNSSDGVVIITEISEVEA